MFVDEIGGGSSVVLLLHGAPSPAADLLPLATRLAERHRVLIPDLPGYGSTPGGDLSYATTNQRIASLLRERGLTRLHGIVGFSGGVLRALYLLLRTRIEADVLVSLSGLAGLDDEDRAAFRGFADMIRADPSVVSSQAMVTLMGERMLSPSWRAQHPSDIGRVGAWLQLTSPSDMAAEMAAGSITEDFRPELGRVGARVYARVGELDQACPVAKSEAIVRGVPGARLDIVGGCGHALLIEDAEATVQAVETRLNA
jgi:pimeloyl-ACP methyl ester carboxylesterase